MRPDATAAVLGLSVPDPAAFDFRGGSARAGAQPVRAGGCPATHQRCSRRGVSQRRDGFRLHRRRCVATVDRLATFTGGFDLSSACGLELGFDERRSAEVLANRFQTEHHEVVIRAGDMEWALPGPDLAPRGLARRPVLSQLLRRPAGKQVRQGGAVRRGRRRAVRRLSLAVLPCDAEHVGGRLFSAILRIVAEGGARRRQAPILQRRDAPADRRSFPLRDVSRRVPVVPRQPWTIRKVSSMPPSTSN